MRTDAGHVAYPDCPVVRLRRLQRDGQPETEAAPVLAPLNQRAEQLRRLPRGSPPQASITSICEPAVGTSGGHAHRGAFVAELERVLKQVGDGRPKQARVGVNLQAGRHGDDGGDLPSLRFDRRVDSISRRKASRAMDISWGLDPHLQRGVTEHAVDHFGRLLQASIQDLRRSVLLELVAQTVETPAAPRRGDCAARGR